MFVQFLGLGRHLHIAVTQVNVQHNLPGPSNNRVVGKPTPSAGE